VAPSRHRISGIPFAIGPGLFQLGRKLLRQDD
jgi:hypothetical protein